MADVQEAQRLTPKGHATRERIVRTAADLIFARGVAGTSVEDVRDAAGASGSQMTHYFQDKHSLVRAVIAFQEESAISQHQQPELGGLNSFEALELWAEQNIARQREANGVGGCGFGSLAGELAETDQGSGPTSPPASSAGRHCSATASRPCAIAVSSGPMPTLLYWRRASWPPCKAGCCSPGPPATSATWNLRSMWRSATCARTLPARTPPARGP
jgi:Bacterial regulatory proteins, tetR family